MKALWLEFVNNYAEKRLEASSTSGLLERELSWPEKSVVFRL